MSTCTVEIEVPECLSASTWSPSSVSMKFCYSFSILSLLCCRLKKVEVMILVDYELGQNIEWICFDRAFCILTKSVSHNKYFTLYIT